MNNRQLDCQNEKGKTMKRGEKMGTAGGSCAKALVALLAAAVAFAVEAVTVNSVAALQSEIANATNGKEIIIAAGTYNLSGEPAMHAVGHLYSAVKITLRGATGDPKDVVLVGSGNRILYLKAAGNTIRDITFKGGDCSGNASSSSSPEDNQQGGAICLRADKDSTLVSNCIFDGNTAKQGGAVANYYSYNATTLRYAGTFIDCVFTNNTTTSGGGGAGYNLGLCRRCTFSKNVASYGSAIRQVLLLDDCDFNDNGNGIKDYGTIYNDGAATGTNQVIVNCRFRRNTCKTYGGALYGGNNKGRDTLIDRCLFESNSVTATSSIKGEGGAIYGMTNVHGCVFIGNSAYKGGALSSGSCYDSLLSGNTAAITGGAAYGSALFGCTNTVNSATPATGASELDNSSAEGCVFDRVGFSGKSTFYLSSLTRCRIRSETDCYMFYQKCGVTNCLFAGGSDFYLLYNTIAGMSFVNCTIADNTYKGLKVGGSSNQEAEFVNCLFWNNQYSGKAAQYDIGNDATAAIKEFRNCIFRVQNNSSAYAPGSDNIYNYGDGAVDPKFVGEERDALNPYALRNRSSAIDIGEVSSWMADATDIRGAGYPRLRDGKVDIGCYQCWLKPRGTYLTFH